MADHHLIAASELLAESYKELADRIGVLFADAGKWSIKLVYDGVHFAKEGHRVFASKLWEQLVSGKGE